MTFTEADGRVELQQFAFEAMSLEDASVSFDHEAEAVTVTSTAHADDEISVRPVIETAEEFDLRLADVVADFDAGHVRVEVAPR